MLKCKHCHGTEFGLTVVETKVSGFKAINGEVVEQMGEPEVSSETKISFCFGCMKPITEEDTYEGETCPICNKEVEKLIDGRCSDCDAQVKALASMSKEDLIFMMLQGKMPQVKSESTSENTNEVKEDEKKPVAKKTTAKKVEKTVEQEQEVEKAPAVKNNETNVSDKVVIDEKEANANLEVDDVNLDESGLDFVEDDVTFEKTPDFNINDDDILAQIDSVVDIDSLNIMNEDIDLPI